MGPTIILDKSAFQSLSKEDTYELSRYFYTVIPPVLILEILADLKKPKLIAKEKAHSAVMCLAEKVQPVDGFVNVDYRMLCAASLLGQKIEMDRRPIIAPGRTVVAENGSKGEFIDVQPENEALIRWSCGRFDEAEQLLATKWRAASQTIDLAGARKVLRGHVKGAALSSPILLRQMIDKVVADPSAQLPLLTGLLRELQPSPAACQLVISRWRGSGCRLLAEFAGYASHCVKVNLIFQLALLYELIGTRSTNRIDMEYLYYTPFAHIFCSGDKVHRTMANITLDADQSFVWHDDLRRALRQLAEARRLAKESGLSDWHQLQPGEGSLVSQLWVKHLGHCPKRKEQKRPRSPESDKALMEKLKPLLDACKKAERDSPPKPKWPCP